MDEELGGVNPNSFFEQITEVRGVAETAQKTSNSNLNLLNELKEKVEVISNDLRLIKDKQFADEDRRQKEEMEAKVKEQNEKTKGAVVGDEGGSKGGKKGGGGGIMGFVTSLVGGLVGGVTGLAIQGVGGIIGLGAGVIDAGKKLGEKIKGLFGKKKDKNKKGGKVKTDKLMGVVGDEDDEKKKENDKNLIKEEIKQELGLGERLKETGGNILGGIKKTLGGIKDTISNFDGRPGSRKTKGTKEIEDTKENEEKQVEEKKPKYYADYIKEGVVITEIGPNDFHFKYPNGRERISTHTGSSNAPTVQQRFDGLVDAKIQYKKEQEEAAKIREQEALEFGKEMHKRFPESYNADGTRKESKIDKKFSELTKKKKKKKRNIFGFNQGGEVDSVPAMLTPGEFVVTKDAVQKVGVDTLKGLNASVGATNKPKLMEGTTDSYLGEHSVSFAGFNKGPIEKSMRMTDEGLVKTYTDDTTDIYEISDDNEYFYEKNEMIGAGLSTETIERYNIDETLADGAKDILTGEVRRKSIGVSIGVPDLIAHKNQLMSEINKLEGFEKVTFDQFMKKEHGIPKELLLPILFRSDASKATGKKIDRAEKMDREQGVQPASAYMNPVVLGYRQNQINPTRYTSFDEQITTTDQSSYKYDATKDPTLTKGFNQGGLVTSRGSKGGLVTPIIESKNESGEMKLIKNLSQSVDNNRQTLMIMEKQNEVMNPPNQNPNPVALADTPQTAPAQLQETEAPIPFASLLRQSAQRYLNLGNNAMVIS